MMSISAKKSDEQSRVVTGGFQAKDDELFRIAFQFAAFGMAIVSLKGKVIKANPYLCRLIGFSEEEITGKSIREVSEGWLLPSSYRNLQKLLAGLVNSYKFTLTCMHKLGYPVVVQIKLSVAFGENKEPLYYIVHVLESAKPNFEHMDSLKLRERMMSLMDQTPFGIVSLGRSGNIVEINSTMCRLLKYSREDLLGRHYSVMLGEQSMELGSSIFSRKSLQKGTLILQNKVGIAVEVKHTYIPIGEMGKDEGVYLICWDLSKVKKVKKMLHDAKKDMDRAIRYQQGIIFKFKKLDDEYVHSLIDGNLLYQVGLTPQNCLGKTFHDFLPGTSAEIILSYYDKAWSGKSVMFESDLFGRSVQISLRPIWENGQVSEVVGSVVDISERRKAEDELRETKELLESFIQNTMDAIVVMSLDGVVLQMNEAMEHQFGWSREEMVGSFNKAFPDISRDQLFRALDQVSRGEKVAYMDFTCRNKRGQSMEVYLTLTPLRGRNGQIAACAGIVRDVTAYRETERKLLRSEKLSAAGQLAAGLAHEIRNPLTSLKGFVQLLQSKNPDVPHYYEIMLNELDRINFIVSEFLTLAKPEMVHYQLNDVTLILKSVVTLLESQALLRGIIINVKCNAKRIQPVICSEMHVKQVFVNVIKNSLEASADYGTIEVEVTMREQHVVIRCTDYGVGIPPEKIPKLGEPFFTTKEKGTGLGLMMCQQIMEAHQGSMKIESQLGKGTRVELCLPVVPKSYEQATIT